jgi:hypothetical protein
MFFVNEITDPAKAAEIKDAIRNPESIFGVADVTVGEHPEHGPVVLIQGDQGALLVEVRRSWSPAA